MALKEPTPQIPWAKNVKVTAAHVHYDTDGVTSIYMELPGIEAQISAYGDVSLKVDSRKNINDSMSKSDDLTRKLRQYLKAKEQAIGDGFWDEDVIAWLRGKPFPPSLGPWGRKPAGVLDWWPEVKQKTWPRIGRVLTKGSSDNISKDWIGSRFSLVHFQDEYDEEGLVILWPDRERPEVWTGDVNEFFSSNMAHFDDSDAYESYNRYFENGFLWALDYMGTFEGKKKMDIPEWAVDTIATDPELLWPELVEKLSPNLQALPEKLEWAILTWVGRRREEAEAEAGQGYFWPQAQAQGEESGKETS